MSPIKFLVSALLLAALPFSVFAGWDKDWDNRHEEKPPHEKRDLHPRNDRDWDDRDKDHRDRRGDGPLSSKDSLWQSVHEVRMLEREAENLEEREEEFALEKDTLSEETRERRARILELRQELLRLRKEEIAESAKSRLNAALKEMEAEDPAELHPDDPRRLALKHLKPLENKDFGYEEFKSALIDIRTAYKEKYDKDGKKFRRESDLAERRLKRLQRETKILEKRLESVQREIELIRTGGEEAEMPAFEEEWFEDSEPGDRRRSHPGGPPPPPGPSDRHPHPDAPMDRHQRPDNHGY